ncbi:MAG: 2-oxoacid:acceptor oxidoreductase family protein, partial [Candidatus Thermoplasmatota archaeon]|nr:2-oxoacid:acceptor oxidoreductase family protein [Candidatus Thermoplasmatota archaeon]
MNIKEKDVSLVIAGEAGQGIQTIERLLIDLLHHSGYYVFSTKEYMSRVRGGSNSTTIRISSHPVQAFVNRIDILIVLNKKAFDHVSHRVTNNTIIIGDDQHVSTLPHPHVFAIDIINKAKNIGNSVYANTIAVGLLASLFHIPRSIIEQRITLFFQNKSKEIIKDNVLAINKGQDLASRISGLVTIPKISKKRKDESSIEILLNGTQAIGLGALAGGCNFISSYPMSPSTGVLSFL